MNARLLAALLAGVVSLTAVRAQQQGADCPAAGAARLGRTWAEAAAAIQAAAQSSDDACAARALAWADLLDRRGRSACSAADRLASETDAEAPDMLALRAALEWRCGRARPAFDLARAALAADEELTLAWRVLGRILEARMRPLAAAAAYRRALALDPADVPSLSGLSSVTGDRAERIALLRRVAANGPVRREPPELVRSAKESVEFLEVLGDRPVWVLEKAELPGELELDALVVGPGRISGWIASLELGAARRVPVLIDSGASGLHLDNRLGKKAQVETLSSETLVGGGGPGEHDVSRGLLRRVVVGPFTFRDGLGVVAAQDSLHRTGSYRAILGMDVFGTTRVEFIPRRPALRIEEALPPQDGEDPLALDPWPTARGEVPIFQVEGQLLAPARFAGRAREASVLVLLDTGASSTLLDTDTADLLGDYRKAELGTTRGYGGDIGLTGEFPALTLELGELSVPLREIPVIDLSLRSRLVGVHVGGFVGLDVWSRHGLVLDLASGVFRARPGER